MSDTRIRRLSAILFTDMVGYTDLMARDEQYANRLRKRQAQVLNDLHAKYQGEILQFFGDGTLSIFDSAVNAVRCATDIQLALQKEPKVPLRIGIHSGEVVWEEDGLYGHAVNIASRLETMASPGSILVSDKIREEVNNHPELQLKSLGIFELKNVPTPIELWIIDHPDLHTEVDISSSQEKGKKLIGNERSDSTEIREDSVSLAVLSFEDLSPGKDQDYLCEGIADEIITDLSGLQEIRVIARHSSSQLKGTQLSIREIGERLEVGFILTGSVRKAGDNLRITTQLIQASNNRQIWADKFRGTMEDIFDLQETISRQVIQSLDLRLNKKENERLENRPIEDPVAYEAYLRARKETFQMSGDSLRRAERLIEQAMDIIGPNPLLIGMKGQIHMSYIMLGMEPDPVHLQLAEKCLDELKHIDPDSIYLHLLRGLIRYKQARIQEAADNLKKVLEEDPSNRDGLLYLGLFYLLAGHAKQAEPLFKQLVEIDPLTAVTFIMPGYARFSQGDLKGGIIYYEKAYTMDPYNPMLMLMMGLIVGRVKPVKEVIPILTNLEGMGSHIFARVGRFARLAFEGKKTEAFEAGKNSELQNEARWDEHSAWWMAGIYAYLDEKEEALTWLKTSIKLGNYNYPLLAKYDPFLESLREEPDFKELMEKIKQKSEAFRI